MMSRLIEQEGRWVRALLILATLTVALVFTGLAANVIVYFSDIILILVMAWVFAFLLSPLVDGIKRLLPALPRSLVVVVVYGLLFLILAVLGLIIATQLAGSIIDFTDELPSLQQSLPEIVEPYQQRLDDLGLQVDLVVVADQTLQQIAASSGQFVGPLQDIAFASLGMLGNLMFMGQPAGLRQPDHATALRHRSAALPDQRGHIRGRLHPGPGYPGRGLWQHRRGRQPDAGHRVHAPDHGAGGRLPVHPLLRAVHLVGTTGGGRHPHPA